jgi:hypothetical protein
LIARILAAAGVVMLGSCSGMGLTTGTIGVVTEEYGQCVAKKKAMTGLKHKKYFVRSIL